MRQNTSLSSPSAETLSFILETSSSSYSTAIAPQLRRIVRSITPNSSSPISGATNGRSGEALEPDPGPPGSTGSTQQGGGAPHDWSSNITRLNTYTHTYTQLFQNAKRTHHTFNKSRSCANLDQILQNLHQKFPPDPIRRRRATKSRINIGQERKKKTKTKTLLSKTTTPWIKLRKPQTLILSFTSVSSSSS